MFHFDTARIKTKNTHGTGCTFSSTIASQLAKGVCINEAVRQAKEYVTMTIKNSLDIALAVNAAGVHIGQSDLPTAVVREIIGDNMLLGVSVSSVKEAQYAMIDGVDYLMVWRLFLLLLLNTILKMPLRKLRNYL